MSSKKNNNKKKGHQALTLIILSLSVVSLIITISAPNYSSAQVSDSQNATRVGGTPSTIAEVRTLIEQGRMAVQNNDIQGALMNLNSALDALEGSGDGEQSSNIPTTQNEVTDQTTTTQAGTIGSGGAGGAGTAGGIITGNQTTTDAGTIGSGGAGGAGTAGGIMTGSGT